MESLLFGLVALACPIGMGLMMWFMAKGARQGGHAHTDASVSLEELRAEHHRLGAEIECLEDDPTRPLSSGRRDDAPV